MNFGSLFTGIGGFDLVLERAGMTCAWQCENDPKASAVLKRHWPDVENVGDIHDLRRGRVKTIDLICGGFPCQDLSIAGKRAGLAGKRSGLWYEFARVIDEFEPGWVVAENVPGLLSSDGGEDFAIIVQWLAKRGYGVAWRILDAQYFGLAQRRRRVFIVGHLGDGCSAEVLFESEGVFGDTPTRQQARQDPSPTLRKSIGGTLSYGRDALISRPLAFENTTDHMDETQQTYIVEQNNAASTPDMISLRSNPAQPVVLAFNADQDGSQVEENISPTLTHKGDGKSAHGAYNKIGIVSLDGRNMEENAEITGTIQSKKTSGYSLNSLPMVAMTIKGHGGAGRMDSESETFVTGPLQAHSKEHGHAMTTQQAAESNQIVWEMQHASEAYRESGDQAPTLQSRMGTGGNNVPLIGVRRLTPTECERLQGFPDGWTAGQADSSRYRQLGNAVAVPVVEWIAKRITHKASCR